MNKIKKYIKPILGFIILNIFGLALGSMWTDPGTSSEWYSTVSKAPWTPPGFVFGLAWSTIAITFGIFMGQLWVKRNMESITFFLTSFFLNIVWNPLFFYLHWVWIASAVIVTLGINIGLLIHLARTQYSWKLSLWAFPYFIWLIIASSLNLYVAIMN